MADLQLRNGSCRLLFQYLGQQRKLTIGRIAPSEAKKWQGKVEYLLMRLEQHMLEVTRGVSIADFLLHDGKPPVVPAVSAH
jgi:hypothetical protein